MIVRALNDTLASAVFAVLTSHISDLLLQYLNVLSHALHLSILILSGSHNITVSPDLFLPI